MAQQRGRPGQGERPESGDERRQAPRDAGAYIGRMPERATETIPGGVGPDDQRVSAGASQPGPVRGPAPAAAQGDTPPGGHREAPRDPAQPREAGQDR